MQKEAEQVRYYHTKQKLKNYQDNQKKPSHADKSVNSQRYDL